MTFDANQAAYQALRTLVAERIRPVTVWTGAGLSAAADLPTWRQLRSHLQEVASRKAGGLDASSAQSASREVDTIEHLDDMWVAFQRLKSFLGPATFTAEIRASLQAADSALVPPAYDHIWQLPVLGIFNLNLDRLATRAYHARHPGRLPVELAGRAIGQLNPTYFSGRQFIMNLHGILEDVDSWVLTHEDLRGLTRSGPYRTAMQTALGSFTNIFVGLSLDDIAIGGHLERLSKLGVQLAPSFWITDRTDQATDRWAESVGIRVIRYRTASGDHRELTSLFQDLINYVAPELPPPPPVQTVSVVASSELPAREALRAMGANELRVHLNAKARSILAQQPAVTAWEEYKQFSDEYDEFIYRAWYTTTNSGSNRLLDYTLDEEVARGAFGRVYRAHTETGEVVAVKVLLDEIRRQPELLRSYRRGVRSMSILQDRDVKRMVRYRDASEIPAFVVMDWVEGPSLELAKDAGVLHDWSSILTVAQRLVETIHEAHLLPERVLHRDLRPANVMLDRHWEEPDALDVVVLDFDLSWHRGSVERSIIFTSANGYLAPEQIVPRAKESTRSTAIDSFGIGMTLFYLVSGRDPLPDEHLHRDWSESLRVAVGLPTDRGFESLPRQFFRLIQGATADRQAERWDVSRIKATLDRLVRMQAGHAPADTGSLAEELMARTSRFADYSWDSDQNLLEARSASGLQVRLQGDDASNRVCIDLSWAASGTEQRTGLGRYVADKSRQSIAKLERAGWRMDLSDNERGSLHLKASAPVSALANTERAARGLDSALEALTFNM